MPRGRIIAALALIVSAAIQGMTVELSTDEPGNLFTESMPVRIHIRVAGGMPAALIWRAYERNGVRGTQGVLDPATGDGPPAPIVLELPAEPGLFMLEVTATGPAGSAEASLPYAVAVDPNEPDPDGYWGVFLVPYAGPEDAAKAREQALKLRRLGVQWIRLNLWLDAFEDLQIESEDPPRITVRFGKYQSIVRAMQDQGIRVMGEFCHMPEALSSKPGQRAGNSDAGPLFARVPPRSWELWECLVEQTVTTFGDGVDAWEIWNEPNIGGRYWAGTVEEFAQMVKRTSQVIRRVRPGVPVVVGGFTCSTADRENGPEFVSRLLELGVADHLDVFSSHSFSDDYRRLLDAHGLGTLPVWDTEQHDLVSLKTLRLGVARMFHFYSRLDRSSLTDLPALTTANGQPLAAGLTFALAAKTIGGAEWVSGDNSETAEFGLLRHADTVLLVAKVLRPGLVPGQVLVDTSPAPGKTPEWLDALGESHPIERDDKGRGILPLKGFLITRGLADVRVVDVTWPRRPADPEQILVPVTGATFSGKWGQGEGHAPWVPEEPGPGGYVAQLPLTVPRADTYRLYLDGTIAHRLEGERSISPFVWSLDGGRTRLVDRALPLLWREGNAKYAANEPVDPPEIGQYLGGKDVWQELGTVHLSAGKHTFRLELVDRRRWPDTAWCFEFFGLLLRPVRDETPVADITVAAAGPNAGVSVPLANPGFEHFNPRNGREAPVGWSTRDTALYTATGYASVDGAAATLFFPGAGGRQRLSQEMPSGKLAALLGRPLQAGDVLTLRASVRHYWEERGVPPDVVAVSFASRERPEAPFVDRLRCILPGAALTRQYQVLEARYTVTAADVARAASAWRVSLETMAAGEKSGALWDAVNMGIISYSVSDAGPTGP